MLKPVWLICLYLTTLPLAAAQPFDFPGAAVEDPAALSNAVPGLASEVIAAYREDDRERSVPGAGLDFAVELYELTAQGEYVELSFYLARASHVRDRGHRQPLTPGRRQRLDFKSGRLTSRRFQPGSRLVAVLRIIKAPGAQINYGTGKDVSDETIADAKEPLNVKWFGGSFIDVPVRR